MTTEWIAVIAALCSAIAAIMNYWMVYTDRALKERQLKRDAIIRHGSHSYRTQKKLTHALNGLLLAFWDDRPVLVAIHEVQKAQADWNSVEFQRGMLDLDTAMFKAVGLGDRLGSVLLLDVETTNDMHRTGQGSSDSTQERT